MRSDSDDRQLVAEYIGEVAPGDPRLRHLLKAMLNPDCYGCICGELREFSQDRNVDGTTTIGQHTARITGTECPWSGRIFAGFDPK